VATHDDVIVGVDPGQYGPVDFVRNFWTTKFENGEYYVLSLAEVTNPLVHRSRYPPKKCPTRFASHTCCQVYPAQVHVCRTKPPLHYCFQPVVQGESARYSGLHS
jgi:hypothetical protein